MHARSNRWSAHLFLFWVKVEDEFNERAFDGTIFNKTIDFPAPG